MDHSPSERPLNPEGITDYREAACEHGKDGYHRVEKSGYSERNPETIV